MNFIGRESFVLSYPIFLFACQTRQRKTNRKNKPVNGRKKQYYNNIFKFLDK